MELPICAVEVVVDDDEVVRSLLCIFDLLEGGSEALGHRSVVLRAATSQTGAQRGEGGRRDEEVDRIQIGGFYLADALEGVFGRRGREGPRTRQMERT